MNRIVRQAEQGNQEALVDCVQAAYSKYIERIGKTPAPMLADYTTLIAQGTVYVLADEKEVRGWTGELPQEPPIASSSSLTKIDGEAASS
jgi:hypothetical protein